MTLPTNLYTAVQVRELDRVAIKEFGITGSTLMARAAKTVFRNFLKKWPKARNIAIVCGAGNNAGDGFLTAKLAVRHKLNVTVFLLSDPKKLTGDAFSAYKTLSRTKIKIVTGVPKTFDKFGLIVDAIFGTGLSRPVTGIFKTTIQKINLSERPVVAIDIPSGLNADTGRPQGIAVKADMTVTFIGLKQGLFTGAGPEYCGQLVFSDLDVPQEIYDRVPAQVERLDLQALKKLLPKRPRDAHKGQSGHTLIVGGNHGMAGAAQLACEAALRVGSGLVSLATRPEHAALVTIHRPEVMAIGIRGMSELQAKIARATVIGVGPGLGQDNWAKRLWQTCLKSSLPLVVDADALNLLSKRPQKSDRWILTPHAGEAARLLRCKVSNINRNRFNAVRSLQKKYGGIIVLKGCGTLISDDGKKVFLCDLGNPGMATGGMGDALTGIISGLAAQGLSLTNAAKLGVCLHARAGDIAAQKNARRGLIASDVIAIVRKQLAENLTSS